MAKILNKKNIHLFFGEDDFTIAEEIKEAKKDFAEKFGALDVCEVDWENGNLSEQEKLAQLQNGLLANSLFGSDKLLVFKNMLFSKNISSSGKEKIISKYLENPQDNVRLFLIESNLDKRKKIYKELVKLEKAGQAEIKEFTVPVDFQFGVWLQKIVKKAGGEIEQEAVEALAISLGRGLTQKDKNRKIKQAYNLWEASNEIGKLLNYCDGREITKDDVRFLIKSKVDMSIFNLIDNIGSKNKRKAVSLLNAQIDKGANEIYMLTMFVYQFRNLLKVKSLLNEGKSSFEIASETKMHPFVVQKSITQCQRFEMTDLKKIYKKLFDADLAIKTGKMNPRLVLDLLVISV